MKFIVFFIISSLVHAQKEKVIDSEDITSKNIIDKIASKVQYFKKQPRYFIRPIQTNCLFEILVNGLVVHEEYTLEKLSSPKSINHTILKSGPQTITVRMYPIGDAIKDAYGKGETITTLQSNSNVSIKVVKYEAFNISDELDDEIIVMQHNSPTNKKTDEFLGDRLPFYEYTFTFNAEVPYQLEGWSNGEDLSKFDKDELEAAVVKFYKTYQNIYKNSDEDALAKSFYGDLLVIAQAKYSSRKEIEEMWEEMVSELYYKDKEFGAIDNYVMRFAGNGKLVELRHPSMEPVDSRLRGYSAFWFKYILGDRIKGLFPVLDLYIPKGGTLNDLQTIP